MELRPGALDRLQEKLKARTEQDHNFSNSSAGNNQEGFIHHSKRLWLPTSIIGRGNSKKALERLPDHEKASTQACPESNRSHLPNTKTDHLLLLYPYYTCVSKLDQVPSCEMMSDYDFFTSLRRHYNGFRWASKR